MLQTVIFADTNTLCQTLLVIKGTVTRCLVHMLLLTVIMEGRVTNGDNTNADM